MKTRFLSEVKGSYFHFLTPALFPYFGHISKKLTNGQVKTLESNFFMSNHNTLA